MKRFNRKKSSTLALKILLGVLPIVFISLIGVGLSNFYVARSRILKGIQYEIRSFADQTASTLSSFFEQRERDLETLADAPSFLDYYKNNQYGLTWEAESYRNEIQSYFLKFSNRSGVYTSILYLSAKGTTIAAVHDNQVVPSEKIASVTLPKGLQQRFLQRTRLYVEENDERLMYYTKALIDETSNRYGTLVLACDLKVVEEILDQVKVGHNGRAYIADMMGQHVLGVKPDFDDALEAEAKVKGVPWNVIVMASPDEFLSPIAKVRDLTLLFSIIAGLILAAILVLVIRKSVQPIGDMVEGTKRLAQGDLDYRFREPQTVELQSLSRAFNEMATSLQERNTDLEGRIRQLTALRKMEESVIQRLDEESILRTCLQAVAHSFSFDRTALYWVNTEKKTIVGRHLYGSDTMGFSEVAFRKRSVSLGETDVLNEVVRKRKAILVKDPGNDPRINMEFVQESKTKEFLLAPVCGKDKVFGILAADNYFTQRALHDSDKEGIALFANAMGLALENITLVQNLSESEARYRAVLDNSPVAVIGVSKEHRISTWNRGAEQIFAYTDLEIVGKPLAALFPIDSGKEFKTLLTSVIENGSVRDHPMPGKARDGRKLELSLSWGGAHKEFWINKEWTVVIRDVTESKKLQQQIIRSEKLSAMGQLISCIAHELNNPLQAVTGYSQLLLMKAGKSTLLGNSAKTELFDEELEKDLKLIFENSLRCGKIIDNLLLFMRHGEIVKRSVSIGQAINAALELLEYKLKKTANVELEVLIPNDLPHINADLQQIQQIFVNLVNNACDAMSDWPGKKSIKIHCWTDREMVHVEIADSGPGIPESMMDHLFEPFFTTKPEGRGTGLGLTVCREIVEEHGGQIDLTSQVGLGTTFKITLPKSNVKEANKVPKERALPPVLGKNILCVDDELDILTYLIKVVRMEGDFPSSASTFQEAVSRVKQEPYDLIITDIRLGEGSGIELYDSWEKWTHNSRPDFLFLTGDVLNSTLMQNLEKRGLMLLQKPVDMDGLQRAIRSLLGKDSNAKKRIMEKP